MIYLDNAATTKLCDEALEAMLPLLKDNYGNPSSSHEMGQQAAAVLFSARKDMAKLLGCEPYELFFTSGGSEADSMAIFSAARLGEKQGKRHIISQETEHHAVLNALSALSHQGFEITLLDVDKDGRVSPEALARSLRSDTALVSIMTANNEIGTIQPIKELAYICHEHGALFHTDAVQATGHLPIDVQELGCDMLSLSAHKFHGPKGSGALYIRGGIEVFPLIHGGGQERGKRGGTENIAAIAGMSAALKHAVADMPRRTEHITYLRDMLIHELSLLPCASLNGSRTDRLCTNVSFCFDGAVGERLVYQLSRRGICVSAGSACSSGTGASHVLLALGLDTKQAGSAVRFSLSEYSTEDEINTAVSVLKELLDSSMT